MTETLVPPLRIHTISISQKVATLLIKLATAPNVALQPATTVEKRVIRRSPAIAAARPATSLVRKLQSYRQSTREMLILLDQATALMLLELGAAVLAAVPEVTLAAVEVRNATNVEKSVTSLVIALKVAMAVEVTIKAAMVVDMEAAAVAPARLVTPVVAMDTCPVSKPEVITFHETRLISWF
ncbi:MAG: hypothetical protein Q9191_001722 [Dirinaria sp. TL-2023a]